MVHTLPIDIKKIISFPRLSPENVSRYEIYAEYKDSSSPSGLRTELLDTVENPKAPCPEECELIYETHSLNNTYHLPKGIYMDDGHRLRVFIDGAAISFLWFTVNRSAGIFTINESKVKITDDTEVKIRYYRDVIKKEYRMGEDCRIIVRPVFRQSYYFGTHNIIL